MTITGKEKDYKPIVKVNDNNYIISWNKEMMESKDSSSTSSKKLVGEHIYTWESFEFRHKPTPIEIKNFIYNKINSQVEYSIKNYFKWNGYSVKLSKENQADYKMFYDLAVQSEGKSLPVTLKFYKNDKPELYTFELLDEFRDFYTKMVAHINNCLKYGWERKELFHIEDYYTGE